VGENYLQASRQIVAGSVSPRAEPVKSVVAVAQLLDRRHELGSRVLILGKPAHRSMDIDISGEMKWGQHDRVTPEL